MILHQRRHITFQVTNSFSVCDQCPIQGHTKMMQLKALKAATNRINIFKNMRGWCNRFMCQQELPDNMGKDINWLRNKTSRYPVLYY